MEIAGLFVGQGQRQVVMPCPFVCFKDLLIGLDDLSRNAVVLGLPVPQRTVVGFDDINLWVYLIKLPDVLPGPCQFVTSRE